MSVLLKVILSTLFVGLAMPLGATIARFENITSKNIKDELAHRVMAFGAGTLLSTVALILVPEGIANSTPLVAAACFILLISGAVILFVNIAFNDNLRIINQWQ